MPLPSSIAKYEIQRPLKQGGMGALYLGFDPELERQVAIKVLRDDVSGAEPRARFVREARAAAGLRHPNIVTIYDFGLEHGHPYIVMEYIPGHSLAEIIAQRTPLSVPRRLQIVEDLCTAVGYAHKRHLVHRDIKPGNVMFDPDGVVKVLDFGLARTADSALTREGVVMGTLNYMSPEQLSGAPVDHRSDIFAVGAVLYELLAFRQAFGGGVSDGVIVKILQREPDPLPALTADVDEDLADLVHRALRKDPIERYPDLSAMRTELTSVRTRLERADTLPLRRAAHAPAGNVAAAAGDDRERHSNAQAIALLDAAREALSTGEFERALAACDAAIALDPETAGAAQRLKARAEQGREAAAAVDRDASTIRGGRGSNDPSLGPATSKPRVRASSGAIGSGFATRFGPRTSARLLAGVAVLIVVAAGSWAYGPRPAVDEAVSPATAGTGPADGADTARPLAPDASMPGSAAGSGTVGNVAAAAARDHSSAPSPRSAVSLTAKLAPRPARREPEPPPATKASDPRIVEAPSPTPRTSPAGGPTLGNEPGTSPASNALPSGSSAPLVGRALPFDGSGARLVSPPLASNVTAMREERARAPSDAQLIEQTLQQYAAAMSAMDLDALQAVVTMDAAARRRQASTFERYVALTVQVRLAGAPAVSGTSATVRCAVEEAVEVRGRPRRAGTSEVDVTLRKSGGHWKIVGFVDR